MPKIPTLNNQLLQEICDVIGDTGSGLTGTEILKYLSLGGIVDPEPGNTKRHRLFTALSTQQSIDGDANKIMSFVTTVLNPVSYLKTPQLYEERLYEINRILAFAGMEIRDDGKLYQSTKVERLSEATKKARNLRAKLLEREVHPEVLHFCNSELLADNYFHAVFEATKSVAERLRSISGLSSDGSDLIDSCFNGVTPILAINTLRTETEQSEQRGFANLLKGIFGTFRNVTAHAPKITWTMTEADALDLMSMVSYSHRKLDKTVAIPRSS